MKAWTNFYQSENHTGHSRYGLYLLLDVVSMMLITLIENWLQVSYQRSKEDGR